MQRYETIRRVGICGIVGNIFLFVIKIIAGIVFKSQAMISDALNSAGDIFSSFMTIVGNKIATKPKDENHNFGYGKVEYIFSFIIGISMIFVAIKIFYSLVSVTKNSEITYSSWLISACIVSILVKVLLYIYSRISYKKYNSILLKSNMKDHRNDCIIMLFTTISIIFSRYNLNFADKLTGILIAIWIFYTGTKILIQSFNMLLDKSLCDTLKNEIINYVKENRDVIDVESINSFLSGEGYNVFLTIFLDKNISVSNSYAIVNKIEEEISKKFNIIDSVKLYVKPYNRIKNK